MPALTMGVSLCSVARRSARIVPAAMQRKRAKRLVRSLSSSSGRLTEELACDIKDIKRGEQRRKRKISARGHNMDVLLGR